MTTATKQKLDFNHIRPLERRDELTWLLEQFENSVSNNNKDGTTTTAVLLQAAAGTGKSTLLHSFMQHVVQKKVVVSSSSSNHKAPLICYGKFEARTAALPPFAAIIDAMDTLMERLLQQRQDEPAQMAAASTCAGQQQQQQQQRWSKRIRESLTVELDLLADLFPSFRGLVKNRRSSSASSLSFDFSETDATEKEGSFYFDGFGNMADKEWRFERLRLAMRALFRCISSYAPVVFCLDDLHWVDPDSLALIRTLLADSKKGRQFMFVGTARTSFPLLGDDDDDDDDLPQLQVLTLAGFAVEQIAALVGQILQHKDLSAIQPLAACLHRHTAGNALVVMHYLRRLHDQHDCFTWDETKECWTFDEHEALAAISCMEKPADVVRETLQSLDDEDRLALLVAASFGTSYFEVTTIVHALEVLEPIIQPQLDSKPQQKPQQQQEESMRRSRSVDPYFVHNRIRNMRQAMARLTEKGFVTPQSPDPDGGGSENQYIFAHDSIREAAYELLPEGRERKEIHLGIGRQIRLWMDTESELGVALGQESLVLHAAKHLNRAADLMDDPWELVDLAELNYQAAELVAQKSSFFPALEHLQFGIQILGEDGWKEHFALSQKLHLALTRIHYSLGRVDECIQTADTVIAHCQSWRDRRPVYHTKIFGLMQQRRIPEAMELVQKVLKDLGQDFPKRFLNAQVTKGFKNATKLLKGKTDADLLALPTIDNEDINDSIEFMERMGEMALRGADPAYFSLFAFRTIHLTITKGLFPLSTLAFVTWACCQAEMGNHDEAVRFGKLALKVADKGLGRFRDTRTRFMYWNLINHWRRPLKESVEPMRRAVKDLWDYSALDYVHWHGPALCRFLLACGHNLRLTLVEFEEMGECLNDYKQKTHWKFLAPFHQGVLNLLGRSAKSSDLTGDIVNEESFRKEYKADRGALYCLDLCVMWISYMFNEHEHALNAWERLKAVSHYSFFASDCWMTLRVFFSGMVLASMCRRRHSRVLKRKAQSELLQLRLWADRGTVTCQHLSMLVQAELLRANTNPDKREILSLYDKAGENACNLHMIHHQALACELAGRFLLDIGDRHLSLMYICRSVELYEIWGATGKSKQLETEFRDLLSV